ncbi:hypothetical protein PUN28_013572 [Cardiocondyla obscurior]|uniref:Uncharacterized protein n=1 Tax=Cardiocondyla obscurior TaxID=286306 RepID=A0AAW2F779_9HYME
MTSVTKIHLNIYCSRANILTFARKYRIELVEITSARIPVHGQRNFDYSRPLDRARWTRFRDRLAQGCDEQKRRHARSSRRRLRRKLCQSSRARKRGGRRDEEERGRKHVKKREVEREINRDGGRRILLREVVRQKRRNDRETLRNNFRSSRSAWPRLWSARRIPGFDRAKPEPSRARPDRSQARPGQAEPCAFICGALNDLEMTRTRLVLPHRELTRRVFTSHARKR